MKLVGSIVDFKTKETLPGANIFISDKDGKPVSGLQGTRSDFDGNYTLSDLDNTNQYITVSFIGYKPVTRLLEHIVNNNLSSGLRIVGENKLNDLEVPYNVHLIEDVETLPTFSVVAKKPKYWLYAVIGIVAFFLFYYIYRKMK